MSKLDKLPPSPSSRGAFCECRALDELDAANYDRFVRIVDVACEQSTGSGESDLRRLRRQFSTLKNTFLHYDVKEAFVDGELQRANHTRTVRQVRDLVWKSDGD